MGMTKPAGRRLILMTIWQVLSATYVGSIRQKPLPLWSDAPQRAGARLDAKPRQHPANLDGVPSPLTGRRWNAALVECRCNAHQ